MISFKNHLKYTSHKQTIKKADSNKKLFFLLKCYEIEDKPLVNKEHFKESSIRRERGRERMRKRE